MLMNAGGAVEPVIDVDIKSRAAKHGYGWIAKPAFDVLLFGKGGGCVYPANDVPGIEPAGQTGFDQNLRGDIRKRLLAVILRFPTILDELAELLKFLHASSFPFVIWVARIGANLQFRKKAY